MMDLIKSTARRELAVPLFQQLLEIQRETGDPLDLRAAFPRLATGLDGEKSR
jgi:hypothetical protein